MTHADVTPVADQQVFRDLPEAGHLGAVARGHRGARLAPQVRHHPHAALTRACRDGDTARARQLIIEHTQQVRGLVRDVIDRAGGAL